MRFSEYYDLFCKMAAIAQCKLIFKLLAKAAFILRNAPPIDPETLYAIGAHIIQGAHVLTDSIGGLKGFQPEYLDDYVNAAAYFSTSGGGSDDINASYNPSTQIDIVSGNLTLLSASFYRGPDANPAAFANFTRLPTISSTNGVRSSLSEVTSATDTAPYEARTKRYVPSHSCGSRA